MPSQSGPDLPTGPGEHEVSVSMAINPLHSHSVGLGTLWAMLEPHCPEPSAATSCA